MRGRVTKEREGKPGLFSQWKHLQRGGNICKGGGTSGSELECDRRNQLAAPTKAKRFLPALLNMVHYGSSSASFSSSKHTDWPGHVLKQYQGKNALDQIGPDRINLE